MGGQIVAQRRDVVIHIRRKPFHLRLRECGEEAAL